MRQQHSSLVERSDEDIVEPVALPGSESWATVGNVTTSTRPRNNGSMNALLTKDAPAHDWYRFVLSFPPHLVRDYATRFGLNADSRAYGE